MLTQIEKVDGLGVFNNYKKNEDVPDFEKFNVFYGLNGSGKTTLSQLFSILKNGTSEQFPNINYTVNSKEGSYTQRKEYPCRVRVFNSDFVLANIGQVEGRINPIFVIGEENKDLVAKIIKDEKTLVSISTELTTLEVEKGKLEKQRGNKFTDIAKVIASDTSGQATRTYRKNNAESAFKTMANVKNLSKENLELHKNTLRQKLMDSVDELVFEKVILEENGEIREVYSSEALRILAGKVTDDCNETSASETIRRLKESPDIAYWIEEGIGIHEAHESTLCEYCFQKMPETRLSALENHFNDSDKLLKEKIENHIIECDTIKKSLQPKNIPGKHQLYDEFHEPFHDAIDRFYKERDELFSLAESCLAALKNKLIKRTEIVEFELDDIVVEQFIDSIKNVNQIIKKHNDKSANFEESITESRDQIEVHHLSLIKYEVNNFDSQITDKTQKINTINQGNEEAGIIGIDELRQSIVDDKAEVSNLKIASNKLNELLHTFLGRSDLRFEPEEAGYRIIRNGKVAKRLSEGEKTAITFIYFIVHLGDQDFNISEGIVVIDDPVSSLDANSLYQAFSFLKNSVKNAKQIFIFTHNFDFLKLLLNWFQGIPKSDGKKSYYMLLCSIDNNEQRSASINPLDKELLENKNEYSFLFKQLFNFRSDGTIAGSYHIPNIARKVLESFLDFYYPGSESMYKKMEKVNFDDNKKTAIMKFSNDLSHPTGKGFDPALIQETQNNVKCLLEMIESISPIHFASLKSLVQAVS